MSWLGVGLADDAGKNIGRPMDFSAVYILLSKSEWFADRQVVSTHDKRIQRMLCVHRSECEE